MLFSYKLINIRSTKNVLSGFSIEWWHMGTHQTEKWIAPSSKFPERTIENNSLVSSGTRSHLMQNLARRDGP